MTDFANHYLVNGEPVSAPALLLDRGFQYGDGVFRTLAVYQGQIQDLDGQLKHLRADAIKLGFDAPLETLEKESEALVGQAGNINAALKILVTRGSGQRGYAVTEEFRPNRYIYLTPPPKGLKHLAEAGVRLSINPYRLAHNERLAGIKHLNRLEQILAKQAMLHSAGQDSLILDVTENIISASQANLFFVRQQTLCTPRLGRCGIAGRTRARLLDLGGQVGLRVEEGDYELQNLHTAEELFICNSLIGIQPVTAVDEIGFSIGPVTRQLQALLNIPALS